MSRTAGPRIERTSSYRRAPDKPLAMNAIPKTPTSDVKIMYAWLSGEKNASSPLPGAKVAKTGSSVDWSSPSTWVSRRRNAPVAICGSVVRASGCRRNNAMPMSDPAIPANW